MLDLLRPIWQPIADFLSSRTEQFEQRHAEAYPETSGFGENEAMDAPPPSVFWSK